MSEMARERVLEIRETAAETVANGTDILMMSVLANPDPLHDAITEARELIALCDLALREQVIVVPRCKEEPADPHAYVDDQTYFWNLCLEAVRELNPGARRADRGGRDVNDAIGRYTRELERVAKANADAAYRKGYKDAMAVRTSRIEQTERELAELRREHARVVDGLGKLQRYDFDIGSREAIDLIYCPDGENVAWSSIAALLAGKEKAT